MKSILATAVILSVFASNYAFASKVIQTVSSSDFATTVSKVESFVKAKKLRLFTKIDHAENAKSAKVELKPNTLFIVGNPKVGSPIMMDSPGFGIDLPVKIHVYENKAGKVVVAYNSPSGLSKRHGGNQKLPQLMKMTKLLKGLEKQVK